MSVNRHTLFIKYKTQKETRTSLHRVDQCKNCANFDELD